MLFKKRSKLLLVGVGKFSSSILEKIKSLNVDDKVLFDVRLSLEEALINAVQHGNKADKKKKVLVEAYIDNDCLYVKVEDEGKGFNSENTTSSIEDRNIEKLSGRGVFLIKQCMDKVKFSKGGSRIVMVKYLNTHRKQEE